VPSVSSEKREYVPMGFIRDGAVANNLLLMVATPDLSVFGLLQSRVFAAWNKAVSGRLEERLRISAEVTYNNFPWPELDDVQRAALEGAAQGVLDARGLFPSSSLADLYDPLSMPGALRVAHEKLDRVVLSAYGLPASADELAVLGDLFTRYAKLTAG
jgi:hypothetical protein